MDIVQFVQVIEDSLSINNQVREQAEVVRSEYFEKYPIEYLDHLLNLIVGSDTNENSTKFITILFSAVKHHHHLKNSEIFLIFFENLCQSMDHVFSSQNIPHNTKIIFSQIIGILIYRTHQSNINSDKATEFIINLGKQNNKFLIYVVEIIHYVISNAKRLLSFPLDFIFNILSDNFDSTSQIKLYFALIPCLEDKSQLIEIFPKILQMVNSQNILVSIQSISNLVEVENQYITNFICDARVIGLLTDFLCRIALSSQDENILILIVFIFYTIIERENEMARCVKEFFVPVIKTLIKLIAQFDDISAIGDETSLSNKALDCLYKFGSFDKCLCALEDFLDESLSNFESNAIEYNYALIRASDSSDVYRERFITLLIYDKLDDILQLAILYNLKRQFGVFSSDYSRYLNDFLAYACNTLAKPSDLLIVKVLFEILSQLFKQSKNSVLEGEFPILDIVVAYFNDYSDEETMYYVLDTFVAYAKYDPDCLLTKDKNEYSFVFELIIEKTDMFFERGEFYAKLVAINALLEVLSATNIFISDKLKVNLIKYFQLSYHSLVLYFNMAKEIDQKSRNLLRTIFFSIIEKIQCTPSLLRDIISTVANILTKEPNLCVYEPFLDSANGHAIYTQSGESLFIYNHDLSIYEDCLKTLNEIIKHYNKVLQGNFDSFLQMLNRLLRMKHGVFLARYIIEIARRIVNSVISTHPEKISSYLELWCILINDQFPSKYGSESHSIIYRLTSDLEWVTNLNISADYSEFVTKLLNYLIFTVTYISETLDKEGSKQKKYRGEFDDAMQAFDDTTTSVCNYCDIFKPEAQVTSILLNCSLLNYEITREFFMNNLQAMIYPMLMQSHLEYIGLNLYFGQFCILKDYNMMVSENYINVINNYFFERKNTDYTETVINTLCMMFEKFNPPPEICIFFFDLIHRAVQEDYIVNEGEIAETYALNTLTILMSRNPDVFGIHNTTDNEYINKWILCFPAKEEMYRNDISYLFLVELLQRGIVSLDINILEILCNILCTCFVSKDVKNKIRELLSNYYHDDDNREIFETYFENFSLNGRVLDSTVFESIICVEA